MPNFQTFAKAARVIVGAIWAVSVSSALVAYIYDPSAFTPDNIALFLRSFEQEIWLVYFLLSAVRGFTLLPSTPLVIAGTMLFPNAPYWVLAVSLGGIFLSSTLIYYFSEFLGFGKYFEDHKPEMTRRLRTGLEHPAGLLFVAAWSFFPLVPTDAVCYVAGAINMRFFSFISALMAGELILCTVYIFLGGMVYRSIFS